MAPTAPDATVTVIAYNDAERLPRAVESVRRQTLRTIEIIISDDHSTDSTEKVARALARQDERIVYHRLAENSGGCSAPRNAAIEIARAPHLMFLDSDDELPERACEVLLAALRGDDSADFAMGAVDRVRIDTGSLSSWQPHLFTGRRTVRGIRSDPGMLFDPLSTNKMYRREFIDRHALRFPLGVHYEDQLFSAQAYCLANAFTIVPDAVYRWYIAPYEAQGALSISNQRHRIENVRDRLAVARLIDGFLEREGFADVQPDKDYKFLKHDLRLYLGDLPYRDPEWIRQFADEVCPYLADRSPKAFERLPRDQRVVIRLLCDGRYQEAQEAARGLGREVGPRQVAEDAGGRIHWGPIVPADPQSARELDITDLQVRTRPFRSALLRHEITRIEPAAGAAITLEVRTYDPGSRLPMAPVAAELRLAPTGRQSTVRFRLDPAGPGLFEGTVTLDLAAVRLPVHGFSGTRHPVISVSRGRERSTGLLLAPLSFPRRTMEIPCLGGLAGHTVTVEPEGHGAGRLQVVWERAGLLARAEPHLPALRRIAGPGIRRLRGALSGLKR